MKKVKIKGEELEVSEELYALTMAIIDLTDTIKTTGVRL